jgi:hypothetical protein
MRGRRGIIMALKDMELVVMWVSAMIGKKVRWESRAMG